MLKCDLDDAAVRKAKQKRRAPPVPSVNQLAWSCDDLLVCLLSLLLCAFLLLCCLRPHRTITCVSSKRYKVCGTLEACLSMPAL